MMPGDVVLIGVPTNSSGTLDGVARAPAVLRQRGLTAALASRPGFTDAGDLALPAPSPDRGPSGLLAEDALIAMIGRVREAVSAARRRGRFPLLVGGDCPVILGALAALQAEQDRPGLLFIDGHEDAWPPRVSPTGEAADCELGLALGLFDADLAPGLRGVLPRIRATDVVAIGPRDSEELAAAGIPTLAGQLRALIRPSELAASRGAAAAGLPSPWWLHTDLDVLATTELASVDYPQPGGLTWVQLTDITSAVLAAEGCAGWSICIYNPDLDPGRQGADDIISYLAQASRMADRRLARGAPGPAGPLLRLSLAGPHHGARSPGAERRRLPAVSSLPRISYARGADGVSLAFTAVGTGPALVFLPLVPFSSLRMEWQNPLLRGVFEQLARRLTVVHYDGRGTGHSQRDVSDLSLEAMVSDLEAVADRAGLAEVSLVGQYNSCPHAIAYAARHPERVRRMVLFGGSARGWDTLSARQTQALLSLIEQDWDLFADTAAHQWMGWSAGDAGRAKADQIRQAVTPQIARATIQAASAADVTELLPGVAAPVLVLHRRGVTQIPVEVSRSLTQGLPRGRLVLLEGAQPALFMDDTDMVASMLASFVCDGIVPAGAAGQPGAAAAATVAPSPRAASLSRRELEVLRLLAAGESNPQIARRLGLSTHTIERHVANLYRKIGARGRADAVAHALRHGLA